MASRLLISRIPLRATMNNVTRSLRFSSNLAQGRLTTATATNTSRGLLSSQTTSFSSLSSASASSSTLSSTAQSQSQSLSPALTCPTSYAPSVTARRGAVLAIGVGMGLATVVASADSDSATSSPSVQGQVPPHQQQQPATALSNEEIAAVAAAINDLLDNDDDEALGPTLVRLAWHASGTYDKETNTGGSDGATMRFSPEANHAANAGLQIARDALEHVKKLFPQISYADLWTLAGAIAIEHMGGPKIVWRQGRRDAADASECTPDGRLPDADKGKVGATIRHVRTIFHRQGFDDREMVALIGAHALGRCHTDRSGYTGPWTRAPTTFSNEYFRELLENTWTLKNWDGPDQFEDPSGDLMMLPADMALLWDKDFRKYVVEFAQDEEKFFKTFAVAFQKLEENGVKAFAAGGGSASGKPWYQFW